MREWKLRLNPVLRIGAWFLGFLVGGILGVLLYAFVCQYPQNAYFDSNRAHPYQDSCKAFAPNSDLKSLAQTLGGLPEPIEERMDGDRVVIRWQSGECYLDLDPATKRVSRIESRAFTGTQWQLEAH